MYRIVLALKSLWNRRLATMLTLISLTLSVVLLIGIARIRTGARESFRNTISQTDLIVGAKGGSTQLLLYSVFRLGTATDNVSYESYRDIAAWDEVAWTIPYSLGDSHRGYRVVGTNEDFYKHYRYRYDKQLHLEYGKSPASLFDVVLGAEVARALNYRVGDNLVLSHGVDSAGFQSHSDKPFNVSGILAPTSTPIDKSLYVSLEAIEAIHMDWSDGAPPMPGEEASAQSLAKQTIVVKQITAFLVGAKSRLSTLKLQRQINNYKDEALMAIIPGVALSELWEAVSYAEVGLLVISCFVVLVALLGMVVTIYNSLNERRREMAILRAVGAGPSTIFLLLTAESLLLSLCACVLGLASSFALLMLAQKPIEAFFGFYIPVVGLSVEEGFYLLAILITGCILGLLPAWRAYRNTLQDGLTIRL